MILDNEHIIETRVEEMVQRYRDIENGIYSYLKYRVHPSYLTEGSHYAVLKYLIKGQKGVVVTPFVLYNLSYTDEDYRRGIIEKAIEDRSFPIDMDDAYRQVESRLTKERLNWDDVVIDVKWEHTRNFVVTKGGVVPKKKQ